jgi:hypothetical protein
MQAKQAPGAAARAYPLLLHRQFTDFCTGCIEQPLSVGRVLLQQGLIAVQRSKDDRIVTGERPGSRAGRGDAVQ